MLHKRGLTGSQGRTVSTDMIGISLAAQQKDGGQCRGRTCDILLVRREASLRFAVAEKGGPRLIPAGRRRHIPAFGRLWHHWLAFPRMRQNSLARMVAEI